MVFVIAFLIVDGDTVSNAEADVTTWINDAPDWVAVTLWPVMQLGTVLSPIAIGLVASTVYGWRRGLAVVVSGVIAWYLAVYVKDIVGRGRPLLFIPDIDVREGSGLGLGFVSGHSAVAFAVATALAPALPVRGRVVAYTLATLVGFARIVYGQHFALDVIGGAALGVMCGCVAELLLLAVSEQRTADP